MTVALTLALAAPAGAGAAAPDRAPRCPSSGKVAVVAGKRVCLASGRTCKATAARQRQYRRNGFTCVRGKLKKVKQEF